MKILVVDDNDDIRLLANTVLTMQGYEIDRGRRRPERARRRP